MTLRYDNTFEDAVTYSEYVNFHTPQLRRRYRRLRVTTPLAVLLISQLAIQLMVGHPPSLTSWITLALMSLLFFAFFPLLYRRSIRRQVKQMQKLGTYRAFLGDHTLTISPDGILSVSPIGESRYKWDAVQRVEQTKEQILLFMSEAMALPVPRRAFASAAHEAAFLASVEQYRLGGVPLTAATPTTPLATPVPTTITPSSVTPSTPGATRPNNAPWWTGQSVASEQKTGNRQGN